MLFLHVGLHKTATTSLQSDVFPNLDAIKFLGRGPGGMDMQSDIYQQLVRTVCAPRVGMAEMQSLQENLEKACREGNVLISEEWLTSGYDWMHKLSGCDWPERIRRLGLLTQNVDVKVLCTIRRPSDGLVSQYKELCSVGILELYPCLSDYVQASADVGAWDCWFLRDTLCRSFSSVTFLNFEDLVDGRKREAVLSTFFDGSVPARMNHLNRRNHPTENSYIRDRRIVDLGSRFMPKALKRLARSILATKSGETVRAFLLKKTETISPEKYKINNTAFRTITELDEAYELFVKSNLEKD